MWGFDVNEIFGGLVMNGAMTTSEPAGTCSGEQGVNSRMQALCAGSGAG